MAVESVGSPGTQSSMRSSRAYPSRRATAPAVPAQRAHAAIAAKSEPAVPNWVITKGTVNATMQVAM